ncbi:hypothetical protein JW926_08465 [Candidatus Sumerlaeota bacterium]|nr:hypothetical protein [Candidatus Sumerlaeota bacterium]
MNVSPVIYLYKTLDIPPSAELDAGCNALRNHVGSMAKEGGRPALLGETFSHTAVITKSSAQKKAREMTEKSSPATGEKRV